MLFRDILRSDRSARSHYSFLENSRIRIFQKYLYGSLSQFFGFCPSDFSTPASFRDRAHLWFLESSRNLIHSRKSFKFYVFESSLCSAELLIQLAWLALCCWYCRETLYDSTVLTQCPLPLYFPGKFSESGFKVAENHTNSACLNPSLRSAELIQLAWLASAWLYYLLGFCGRVEHPPLLFPGFWLPETLPENKKCSDFVNFRVFWTLFVLCQAENS